MNHLFHATPSDSLPSIRERGLEPGDEGFVHLSERDYRETIEDLFGLGPGGMHEFETGRVARAILLEVDVRGLDLETEGPDGEDHFRYRGTIPTWRIREVSSPD